MDCLARIPSSHKDIPKGGPIRKEILKNGSGGMFQKKIFREEVPEQRKSKWLLMKVQEEDSGKKSQKKVPEEGSGESRSIKEKAFINTLKKYRRWAVFQWHFE